MGRVVEVGLSERPLSVEELEELLVGFERRVLGFLRRRLGRRLEDLELVVDAELSPDGRRLSLRVEARAVGRLIAPLSYDEVLAEAIEEAGRWLQERLLRRGGVGEGGEGAVGAGGGGGYSGGGDGS